MVEITLPDGSQRTYEGPVTLADVAHAIGAGLARAALAGRIISDDESELVDTSYLIEDDATIEIVTAKDEDGLEILRHSAAHLMAYAVKELFPEAQVPFGPVRDNGL